MNRLVLLLLCLFAPYVTIQAKAQNKKIEKSIEKATTFQNMTIVYDDYTKDKYHFVFHVKDCRFEKDEVRKFPMKHPDCVITDMEIEYELKWGYYQETVVGFKFYRKDAAFNSLQTAIQLANNDNNLRIPTCQDFQEMDVFYKNKVKRFPELVKLYKKECLTKFTNLIKTDPDATKRFCDGSPYNSELLRDIDVIDLIRNSPKKHVFVYYTSADKGYVIDKQGEYKGEIKNGKADGKGVLEKSDGRWEGTFRNGKMNGHMVHTARIYGYYTGVTGRRDRIPPHRWYSLTEEGECVDDKWNGIVDYKVGGGEDHVRRVYENGIIVSSEIVNNTLTGISETAWDDYWARLSEAEADRERTRSSVNEDNIMNYVRKIDVYKDDVSCSHYDVDFKDGKRGSIYYDKHRGQWSWCDNPGSIFATYLNAKPNSKNGALACLYKALLK